MHVAWIGKVFDAFIDQNTFSAWENQLEFAVKILPSIMNHKQRREFSNGEKCQPVYCLYCSNEVSAEGWQANISPAINISLS